MRRKLALLFFGLGMWGVPGQLKPQAATISEDRIAFAPGGLIRIDHSRGYLNVEGWDRPEVEVTVKKSMPFNYRVKHPEQAGQHLAAITIVAVRTSDKELNISSAIRSPRRSASDVMVDWEIHVPRDSKLVIHHDGGSYVSIGNVTGDIDATSGHGDIILMLPESQLYSIDAKSKFGVVSSEFSGMTHHKLLIGEAFNSASAVAAHRLHLRVGFGGITIVKLPPDAVGPSQLPID